MIKTIAINDIHLDYSLYPRRPQLKSWGGDKQAPYGSWITVHDYFKRMETGAKFPPVVVAPLNGKMVLIDGWHRLQAHKRTKKGLIKAEIIHVEKSKMFLEAVKRNAVHGRQFTSMEKRNIVVRLKKQQISISEISAIIGIPIGDMSRFMATGGEFNSPLNSVPTKPALRHYFKQHKAVPPEVMEIAPHLGGSTQTHILDELIVLLKVDALDMESTQVYLKMEELDPLVQSKLAELRSIHRGRETSKTQRKRLQIQRRKK